MKLNSFERHAFLKSVEELTELSLELIHAVNKTKKENRQKILSEIEDVEHYLKKIKEMLDNS